MWSFSFSCSCCCPYSVAILKLILLRRVDYPIMTTLARKYLAVRGISTPTERVNTKLGLTLTKRKLLTDLLSAYMYIQEALSGCQYKFKQKRFWSMSWTSWYPNLCILRLQVMKIFVLPNVQINIFSKNLCANYFIPSSYTRDTSLIMVERCRF